MDSFYYLIDDIIFLCIVVDEKNFSVAKVFDLNFNEKFCHVNNKTYYYEDCEREGYIRFNTIKECKDYILLERL
jgi:hypothetical protein